MRILFLDILTDDPKLRMLAEQDIMKMRYSELFRKGFGHADDLWTTVDASQDVFPSLLSFDALVISGSMENAIKGQEKPWMYRTYDFIRDVVRANIPVLGVCGGLQFTVRSLGGEVIRNTAGRNFGLSHTKLTDDGKKDALLSTYEDSAHVFVSHSYRAADLPMNCQLLAQSEECPFDAIGYGQHVRLLQFHPEFTAEILAGLAELHKETLVKEGHASESGFADYVAQTYQLQGTGHRLLGSIVPFFQSVKKRRCYSTNEVREMLGLEPV